jgi:hypothetical protein
MLLVLGLVVFASGGAYATSAHFGLAKGHHHAKKHAKHAKKHAKKHVKHAKKHHRGHHSATMVTQHTSSNAASSSNEGSDNESAAQHQYGTRPGKGCGDRNHVHTGPPGNPSNTSCPPQSQHG